MKNSPPVVRLALVLVSLAFLPGLSLAQSAAVSDADIRNAIGITAKALAALNTALGIPREATRDNDNAACVVAGHCEIGVAARALQTSADVTLTEVQQRKADSNMLGSDFTKPAVEGVLPAIKAIPLLTRVGHSAKYPEVPAAMRDSIAMLQSAVDYLKFTGAQTAQLDAALSGTKPL